MKSPNSAVIDMCLLIMGDCEGPRSAHHHANTSDCDSDGENSGSGRCPGLAKQVVPLSTDKGMLRLRVSVLEESVKGLAHAYKIMAAIPRLFAGSCG